MQDFIETYVSHYMNGRRKVSNTELFTVYTTAHRLYSELIAISGQTFYIKKDKQTRRIEP